MILMFQLDDVDAWGMNVDGKCSWQSRESWTRNLKRERYMVWFLGCWILSVSTPPWARREVTMVMLGRCTSLPNKSTPVQSEKEGALQVH